MIHGLAYFSWDTKVGSILEQKYPTDLTLSDDLLNKIYMTHSYEGDYKKDELIDISYKGQIILSYCDKSKVSEVGYEIIILVLDEKERINIYKYKNQLITFAKNFLQTSKENQTNYFFENIESFFDKDSSKKVLLIGRAGTGKTSIKKIIFEGHNPKDLSFNPLEPA